MSASVMLARSFKSAPAQNASSPASSVLIEFIASGRLSVISATGSPRCRNTLIVFICLQASGSGLVPLVALEPSLFLLYQPEQRGLHEFHLRDIGQHDLAVLTRRLDDQ